MNIDRIKWTEEQLCELDRIYKKGERDGWMAAMLTCLAIFCGMGMALYAALYFL